MDTDAVIRFDNLRQRTSIVGELQNVEALKPRAFVSANAHGVIRKVDSPQEVADLAKKAAKDTLELINSED